MAGRPLKFQSVEELQDKIDSYFASKHNEAGDLIKPISITGLALWLDTSRQVIQDYQERDEYTDAIKKAKLRVENFYEEKLTGQAVTGSIFALKNFDWKDKVESNITGNLNISNILGDLDGRTSGLPGAQE